jgi:transcriptional regulator GlxA family with amidase domain
MGVQFKHGGAFPFLGVPADELADMRIALETIWGRCAGEIREQLCVTASPLKRFRLLEKALLAPLFRPLTYHAAVALALDGLARSNSRALVRGLAREARLSDRRFIDVFRFEVDLKPKLFDRVLRFQRVLRLLPRIPVPNWPQIALDYGNFDQWHLIRDFLAFSGFSPADYLRRLSDLRRQGTHIKFNHLPLAR